MRKPCRSMLPTLLVLPVLLLASSAATPLLAQSDTKGSTSASRSPRATSGSDRLFRLFLEDAAIIDNQWWEGQLVYSDVDVADLLILRGVVAFQPWEDVEVGGRVGFGDSDADRGLPDGSGATDLDVWAKYSFGTPEGTPDTEFSVGVVATVPTGDDTAGLGFDAFAGSVFGSLRHRLRDLIVTGYVGVQVNRDGAIFGGKLDGEVSPQIGGAVLYPASDRVTLVGELDYRGERFDGTEADFLVLGGVNWRLSNRGQLRGAVSVGLDDGAPDAQILVGYATVF